MKPLLAKARSTRWVLSLTAASGRPTRMVLGSAPAETSTSTSTGTASMPTREKVCSLASIRCPRKRVGIDGYSGGQAPQSQVLTAQHVKIPRTKNQIGRKQECGRLEACPVGRLNCVGPPAQLLLANPADEDSLGRPCTDECAPRGAAGPGHLAGGLRLFDQRVLLAGIRPQCGDADLR